MKNWIKLFGIIALVAVMGFSIASCKEEPEDPPSATATIASGSNPQTKITITGLTNAYVGKHLVVGLTTTNSEPDALGVSTFVEITSSNQSSAEFSMLNDGLQAIAVDGYCHVVILLYNKNGNTYTRVTTDADKALEKVAPSERITSGSNTIAFSKFSL